MEVRMFDVVTGAFPGSVPIGEMTLDEAFEIQRQETAEWDTSLPVWIVPTYMRPYQGTMNIWHYRQRVEDHAARMVIEWALKHRES